MQVEINTISMLESVKSYLDFSSERYEAGIYNKTGKSDNELLLECIYSWKETVSIDDIYAEKVIYKLEKILKNVLQALWKLTVEIIMVSVQPLSQRLVK